MKNLLLAVAALIIWHPTAMAFWPTTAVTREKAEREKLPLSVAVLAQGNGTVEVKYEITLTGPFAHLRYAEILVADGDRVVFRVPVAPAVGSGGLCGPVKGH